MSRIDASRVENLLWDKQENTLYRKILIVGSTPYNKNTPARAFDAYFHGWKKENLAQIFSNPRKPNKGHAGYFYQITDKQMQVCEARATV